MRRALAGMLIIAVLGGVVSVAVTLRRVSFLAESMTHTVFPGVAIAFFAGASLLAGALVAALASAVLLTALGRVRVVDDDSLLALLLASLFSIGVIVVSRNPTFTSDLTLLLFGRVLTISARDLVETAVVAAIALAVLVALRKELLLRAFDPVGAQAAGYPTVRLDLAFNTVVALSIVAAVRAVGTALVVAMIITPAATARIVTSRLTTMVAASCGLAAFCSWIGLGLSYDASVHHDVNLAASSSVVVLLTFAFVAASVTAAIARRRRAKATA